MKVNTEMILIFMVLEAKNALNRIPTLNDDLLDIDGHYFNNSHFKV